MSILETADVDILTQIMGFADSEPHICVWCRHCGAVVCDGLWGYVCLRRGHNRDLTKRMKNVITPFPVNTEGTRTGVQCVNADERHECFRPTRVTDKRIYLLDALRMLESSGEGKDESKGEGDAEATKPTKQVRVIDKECLTCEYMGECVGNLDECRIAGVECDETDCMRNRDGYCYALRVRMQGKECTTYEKRRRDERVNKR